MNKKILKLLSKFFLLFFILVSCNSRHKLDFEVKDFRPMVNLQQNSKDYKTIYLDYEGAIHNGFIIPSKKQTPDGYFHFNFAIKNTSGSKQKFYYKILYQNESYKFPEAQEKTGKWNLHPLAHENFYGSWENTERTFTATPLIEPGKDFITITDSFRIAGNPRMEKKYFNFSEENIYIPEEKIRSLMSGIKSSAEWYADILAKAKKWNRTIDEQLRMDAVYVISEEEKKSVKNNRWQRNPRVGKYSFMLVVSNEENIQKPVIPKNIQDISLTDSQQNFINPYFYFLFGEGASLKNVNVTKSSDTLKVIAKPSLGNGIFISRNFFEFDKIDTSAFNNNCNAGRLLYDNAAFEQYTHYIDPRFPFENVPVVADVHGGEYTRNDYTKNVFSPAKLIHTPVYNSDCPCKTVHSDPGKNQLKLKNPGTKEGEWKKENVGLITRHGFTYGKYRVKAKLPELLNKDDLWNGLTNAIWLLNHRNAEWNYRRPAPNGFIPKDKDGENAPRYSTLAYSEIDIEIVKAARFWPASSYPAGTIVPKELPDDKNKVMVTYTNWDLACTDVDKFIIGADSIKYNNKYYGLHRWDQYYKALTDKYPALDDEIFKVPYYYFEIEWKPNEIIWRIGPEKDQMKVFGYMNDKVTNIPNNQMLLVITQEFHHTKWWPGAPFSQDRIPFPLKDIIGEVYEIEIE